MPALQIACIRAGLLRTTRPRRSTASRWLLCQPEITLSNQSNREPGEIRRRGVC